LHFIFKGDKGMLIEYKIKFQQDGITITQRIEPGAPDTQLDLTAHAVVRKENHLNRVAPKPGGAAHDHTGSGAGEGIRGTGAGEGIRGTGAGEGIRGTGAGEGIRGTGAGEGIRGTGADDSIRAGRVVVLGPVIINFPSEHASNS
jgi:hypothetical protein